MKTDIENVIENLKSFIKNTSNLEVRYSRAGRQFSIVDPATENKVYSTVLDDSDHNLFMSGCCQAIADYFESRYDEE
jgi:hypothetical protein